MLSQVRERVITMYTDKMRRILRVLQLFSMMPFGGGVAKQPEIIHYAGLPASTTYRYLSKMKDLGLIERAWQVASGRDTMSAQFKITKAGIEYLEGNMF